MIFNLQPLFDEPFFNYTNTVLHGLVLIFLMFNLTLPFTLDGLVILLLNAEPFVESKVFILQLPKLVLLHPAVSLEGWAFIFNHRLRLLNLLHIVLHLALEVIFEETKQILLNIDLLNLVVDSLQLTVYLWIFHLAKTTKLTSHFDDLRLLLVKFVLFALLVDLRNDLWFDQIQLEVNFVETPVLFY